MPGLGNTISSAEVNSRLGQIARDVHVSMSRVAEGLEFLDAHDNNALLQQFQVVGPDASELRAAFEDLRTLLRVYRGEQALPTPVELRVRVRRIAGLGLV